MSGSGSRGHPWWVAIPGPGPSPRNVFPTTTVGTSTGWASCPRGGDGRYPSGVPSTRPLSPSQYITGSQSSTPLRPYSRSQRPKTFGDLRRPPLLSTSTLPSFVETGILTPKTQAGQRSGLGGTVEEGVPGVSIRSGSAETMGTSPRRETGKQGWVSVLTPRRPSGLDGSRSGSG